MKPFHRPGVHTKRAFSGYNELQDAKFRILSDIVYSAAYGLEHTRLPTPGISLPAQAVEERLSQVAQGWNYEADLRDKTTVGFDPRQALPLLAQYHLAERLLAYPQTDRPWEYPKPEDQVLPQPRRGFSGW